MHSTICQFAVGSRLLLLMQSQHWQIVRLTCLCDIAATIASEDLRPNRCDWTTKSSVWQPPRVLTCIPMESLTNANACEWIAPKSHHESRWCVGASYTEVIRSLCLYWYKSSQVLKVSKGPKVKIYRLVCIATFICFRNCNYKYHFDPYNFPTFPFQSNICGDLL